jgi:hypothetical protein
VYRHSLQILLSVAHIFGGTVFFLGAYQQQFKTITKDPLRFWLLFVLMNGIFICLRSYFIEFILTIDFLLFSFMDCHCPFVTLSVSATHFIRGRQEKNRIKLP